MHSIDSRIIELLDESGLVLSPTIVAENLGHDRAYVNKRLAALVDAGLLDRPKQGRYKVTDLGRRYLAGELTEAEVEQLSEAD